jgi:hypothetical protein
LGLVALAIAGRLGVWGGGKLFWPFFLCVQIFQGLLLAVSVVTFLVQLGTPDQPQGIRWLWMAALWGLSVAFYVYSDRLSSKFGTRLPFAAPAAACAMIAPLPLLGIYDLPIHMVTGLVWAWGAQLAVAAELLGVQHTAAVKFYSPFLFVASALLFLGAAVSEIAQSPSLWYVGYLLGAGLVFGALTLRRLRWPLWSAALAFAYLAYILTFSTPLFDQREEIFIGFIFLPPPLILLTFDLLARKRAAAPAWTRPALILGMVTALFGLLTAMGGGIDNQGAAAAALAIYAAFLAWYAWADHRAYVGYFALAYLALALVYALGAVDSQRWVVPLIALAAIYDLAGLGLRRLAGMVRWADVLQISGLALGALVSLASPLEGDAMTAAAVAVMATLYAVEAFRRQNIWLGFPTILLYFIAYALALFDLDVRQPQFYTIGAALLGMVMHYLLTRQDNPIATLATGVLAQLILLSTTYIQMLSQDDFTFFFILFFQALVLLVYGLVVRSRTFVIGPILFLILGVTTAALTILSGLPTVLIIGCTGLLLLILGTLALLLRERLTQAADRWAGRLNNW